MTHTEMEITAELVRDLLRDQHPDLADYPVRLGAPSWAGPALWFHGDLHPANILTADGTICGVIDFGDLFAGDPAVDLAAAWTLLPDAPRTSSIPPTSRPRTARPCAAPADGP